MMTAPIHPGTMAKTLSIFCSRYQLPLCGLRRQQRETPFKTRLKDPDNVFQKSPPSHEGETMLHAKARSYCAAESGARKLAIPPRFSEPMGKQGVQ
jgi:hypothetical protein